MWPLDPDVRRSISQVSVCTAPGTPVLASHASAWARYGVSFEVAHGVLHAAAFPSASATSPVPLLALLHSVAIWTSGTSGPKYCRYCSLSLRLGVSIPCQSSLQTSVWLRSRSAEGVPFRCATTKNDGLSERRTAQVAFVGTPGMPPCYTFTKASRRCCLPPCKRHAFSISVCFYASDIHLGRSMQLEVHTHGIPPECSRDRYPAQSGACEAWVARATGRRLGGVLRVAFHQCFSLRHRSVLGFEMQGPAREQLARINLLARQAILLVCSPCVYSSLPCWVPSVSLSATFPLRLTACTSNQSHCTRHELKLTSSHT